MSIDNSIVRKVGKLAKIKIKESEENKLLDELNNLFVSLVQVQGAAYEVHTLHNAQVLLNKNHGCRRFAHSALGTKNCSGTIPRRSNLRETRL